ncbi:MAG TPA: DUF6029 family protein [Chitinophagales bacterium]|nr:DUF6029 family protein [Chitinophagales bacterium]
MLRRLVLLSTAMMFCNIAFAQPGNLSGDLQSNVNVFQRDSAIGAYNTPLYDNYFTGIESWLNVNYSINGFNAGIRLDAFLNSNLIDPNGSYTGVGIGYYYLEKQIGKLTVHAGHFYEQFGSGIVYRSYEDRGLGVDYATYGLNLKYALNDNWMLKGIAGLEKNLFSFYKPTIKGINLEGSVQINEDLRLLPGAAFLNRTMDQASMDYVVATINSYDSVDRFIPKYNVYAFSGYYTLSWKKFSWYLEAAGKSHEAIKDVDGKLVDEPGTVVYTSLSFSQKGLGLTGQFKRTENYVLRTSPNETLLNGVLNYIPPMARQNSLRLPARYQPATQYLGELAYQFDAVYTPVKGYTIDASFSNINDLSNTHLWTEVYGQLEVTKSKKFQYVVGGQYVFYNQQVYLSEPLPNQTAITPFAEITYKPTRKNSVRFELQYQSTNEDYGSWLFALAEYSIAPKWSFAVSDMYNIDPNPEKATEKNHYYNFFVAYTKNANRFTMSYVRQVAGINCTGGVCRYEPAFSGLKFNLTSSF